MNLRKRKVGHTGHRYPDAQKSFDITSEFVTYLKFLRVLGFAPLSFTRVTDGRWIVTPSTTMYVYSWMFASSVGISNNFILVGLSSYTLYSEMRMGKISEITDRLVKLMEMSVMCGCFLAGSFTMSSRAANMLEYLAVMSQMHDTFGTMEFRKQTDRRLLWIILFTSFVGLLVDFQELYDDTVKYGFFQETTWSIVTTWSIGKTMDTRRIKFKMKCNSAHGTLFNSVPPLFHPQREIQFLMWIIEIRTSATLVEIEQLIKKDMQSCKEPERLVDHLQELQERQSQLRFCSSTINKGFGLPLLMFLVFIMLEVIIPVYYFITYLHSGLRPVFLNLQWIIYLTWWTLLIVEPCHQYVKKDELISQKNGEMILKMGGSMYFERDWHETSKIKLFWSKQMLMYSTPASITACGIMAVNREILASFTGAITTFLVILMQLNNEL